MSYNLEIDLLRSFSAIADTGSLSRAALRLAKTQSALSMQVKRLEELTGRCLLNRGGRGVTLTAHGLRLLAHARDILRAHDRALADLTGRGLSGSVRFGCPDDYAAAFLPGLVGSFTSAHPDVLIEIVCGSTQRLNRMLERHQLDLALVSIVNPHANDDVIRVEPLVWVGRAGFPVWNSTPLPLALTEVDTFDHQAVLNSLEHDGRNFRIAYASASLAGLTAVVRSGQAVAVLTRPAVPADLLELGPDASLPGLPQLGITIAFDKVAGNDLAERFAAHIRHTLPKL
ncbi:LysR family transcriptional regulator [Komagataeibacter swingsii]|uniref:LysR family transcriptional regulator n=1 Tax=Komagataeibacter swingsii TaxID=215220 RepID=A0A2V4R711_9PROT|nr:LysR family transcriptional regulator [Komagataeibacter swingsii]PYD70563.1 LysR family transcriptional regulator [Komagataeibacter swingsii]GBQ59063.1 transcriptional regulator [Komagataeibacter swingsii DSM 16373]